MNHRKTAAWRSVALACVLGAGLAQGALAAPGVSAQQLEKNKQIVLGLTAAMAEKNVEKAASFLADGYIQHNPNVPTGKSGFIGFFTPRWAGQQSAAKPLENPPVEIVAEGDVVMLIFKHATPDPVDASKSYDAFTFDAYRVVDGKIAEHWDAGVRRAPTPAAAAPAASK
ncbi:MAG: nuclear transport factor 2 family protein [Steroidobacteraceae bacterium]